MLSFLTLVIITLLIAVNYKRLKATSTATINVSLDALELATTTADALVLTGAIASKNLNKSSIKKLCKLEGISYKDNKVKLHALTIKELTKVVKGKTTLTSLLATP